MDQNLLKVFVKAAVASLEGAGSDVYAASFAGGSSGLSFGAMQNDVAKNSTAKTAFQNLLTATMKTTGLSADDITKIVNLAATPGVSSSSFTAPQLNAINLALANSHVAVDAQDNIQLSVIMGYVNGALGAAASNPNGPGELGASSTNLSFIAELADWGNRTGGLAGTNNFLSSASPVSKANYDANYLSKQKQFTTGGESFSSWTTRVNAAEVAGESALINIGYYIPQLSDGSTEAAIAASITKQLKISGLTSAVLEQINAPFKDTSWTVGGLVHVPIGAPLTPTVGTDKQLPKLPSGQTYIYDQSTKKVYNVGASLDGHDSGALIFDTSTLNNYSTFAQGTYSGLTMQANGNVSVDVINPNGTALGTETFNPLADTVVATINNGVTTFNTLIGSGTASEVEDKFSAHNASVVEQYTFSQPNGVLKIDNPASFSGTISGFAPGDTIDLAGIGTATSATLSSGNKLVVQAGNTNVTLQLDAGANYKDQNFIVTSDGSGGTDITSTSLVGLNSGNIVLVNPETSTPSTLASLGIAGFNLGVEASENGYLYFGSLGKLYTVNLETGAVSSVAATLPGILKADSLTGALVGVSGANVVAYNPTTGTTKTIASISGLLGVNIQSQAAENGYLYFGGVVSGFQTKFFSVNLTTGQVTSVATSVPLFTGDNSTGTLVGVSGQNVVTINPTTGAQTTIATISGLTAVSLTQVAAENGMFYFVGNTTSNGQHLYSVNIATGQVTTGASTTANFSANSSVRFSVSQLLTYSAGISSGVAGFSVVDTAANIQSNISQLNTLSSSVASITTTDSRISLSASQVGQYSKIVSTISNGVTVSDTAANVVTNIVSLQALATAGKLSSITLTDTSTPTLSLAYAQYTADAAVLGKITNSYNLTVTGVAVANAATVAAASHVTSITVSDTATNVVAGLTSLQALATSSKVSSIVLTDTATPTLSLTYAQYTADAAALGEITSAYNLSLSGVTAANAATVAAKAHVTNVLVSDTAANVLTNIASLQTLAASSKIGSIVLTDTAKPTLTLAYAQYTADTAVLGKITSAYNLTVSAVTAATASTVATNTHVTSLSISDSAANIVTNIAALEGLVTAGKVGSIGLTDSTKPTLTLTAAQDTADAGVLAKITSPYNLVVSGVLATNATNISAQAHVTSVTVSDTAANIVTSLAALQTLATANKLGSISLTNTTLPTLSLTAAQLTADATTLGKITSSYNLAITGVAAANAPTVAAQAHVTSVTVSDTAANVVSNLTSLQTLGVAGKLTSISLTDSTTPTLSLTAAQLTADANALSKIAGLFNETVLASDHTNATITAHATGSNTISFANDTSGVTVDLTKGTATETQAATTYTDALSNFQNIIASHYNDTLTAGANGAVLTGNGGSDTYVLNAKGADTIKDTSADLKSSVIKGFSKLDQLDLTDMKFGTATTLGFSEDKSNSFGTLTVSDGTHNVSIQLLGQYMAAGFQKATDGGAGTFITYTQTATPGVVLASGH